MKNADLFKSLKQLVDDKSYLSEEETNLTQQLEESIREFVGFFEGIHATQVNCRDTSFRSLSGDSLSNR